jgi:hypothetical protein
MRSTRSVRARDGHIWAQPLGRSSEGRRSFLRFQWCHPRTIIRFLQCGRAVASRTSPTRAKHAYFHYARIKSGGISTVGRLTYGAPARPMVARRFGLCLEHWAGKTAPARRRLAGSSAWQCRSLANASKVNADEVRPTFARHEWRRQIACRRRNRASLDHFGVVAAWPNGSAGSRQAHTSSVKSRRKYSQGVEIFPRSARSHHCDPQNGERRCHRPGHHRLDTRGPVVMDRLGDSSRDVRRGKR